MAQIVEFPGQNKTDCKLGSCQASTDTSGDSDMSTSAIIQRGVAVLSRLESNLSWDVEWFDLIVAMGLGRGIAMDAAGAEKPQGPKYRKAIRTWLRCYGFDRIDEGDRSRLVKCFDNLTAINAWRSALPGRGAGQA